MPYTYAFNDMDDPVNALALYAMQLAFVLLLIVVCVNVAILVYARTATRQGEIAVRGALGASRRRIVAQLFVEALMLSRASRPRSASVSLSVALRQLHGRSLAMIGNGLPFWMTLRVDGGRRAVCRALTLLAAAIIGVVPALKATGTQVHTRAADALARQRLAHADGPVVDAVDRRAGGVDGGAAAGGDVSRVDSPAVPHG